jgi:NADH:ubiquinone reductase (H+-translocating)
VRQRVVIVGAGFAGIDCARRLVNEAVEVTLVDRNNFHTFSPLLYQVAAAGLADSDVAHPVRGLFHDAANVRFRQATVSGVDWRARTVLVSDGPDLPFDHLVVAAGATTSFFGVPGADAHSLPLGSLADAVRIRNHVLRLFEAADADPSRVAAGDLTVVVIGGGPTGVEMAGALTELFSMVLAKDFRRLDVARARVVLVELAGGVLPPFSDRARRHAAEQLVARGVELRLGEAVEEVGPEGVRLRSGERIAAATVVWAAGVRAAGLADVLDLPQGRAGRIEVGPDLRVPGRPDVWVAGDMAGTGLPQVAPVAKQQGAHVGRQIGRLVRGRAVQPFRYRDRGSMATVGRRAAVADLPLRIRLTGAVAWVAWLFLHLLYLAGLRNRATVLVNWTWSYLTWDRGNRLITELPAPAPKRGRTPG